MYNLAYGLENSPNLLLFLVFRLKTLQCLANAVSFHFNVGKIPNQYVTMWVFIVCIYRSTGLSDPYCMLFINNEERRETHVCQRTLNPTWNENFKM